MTPLPVVTSNEANAALKRGGFVEVRGKGSHVKMKRAGRTAIVPDHGGKDLPRGPLRGILQQADLSVEAFLKLLER